MNRLETTYAAQRRYEIGKVTDTEIRRMLNDLEQLPPLVKGGQGRDASSLLDAAVICLVLAAAVGFAVACLWIGSGK